LPGLKLNSKAGIPNPRVLQVATWGAATVTKRTDRRGAIRLGYLADLLLVDGDPVADMSNIKHADLVMKQWRHLRSHRDLPHDRCAIVVREATGNAVRFVLPIAYRP
jgi:imidazolonepropionase-like amidohydrolase